MYFSMQMFGLQTDRSAVLQSSFSSSQRLRLVGSSLTLRGADVPSYASIISTLSSPTGRSSSCSGGNTSVFMGQGNTHFPLWMEEPLLLSTSRLTANQYHRSVSALCNGQGILPMLRMTQHRAQQLFEAGAYVHQYTRYGVEEADFIEAFQNLSQIISNYSNL